MAMKVVVYWLTYSCSVLLLPRFNTFSHGLLQVYLPSPATKWAVARSTPDDKMVSHRMLGEIQDMHPKYLYRYIQLTQAFLHCRYTSGINSGSRSKYPQT